MPESARADGDPASDVLATQSVFIPGDGGLTVRQQEQLAGLLRAASAARYPLRVAVIASPADLGSVTELWRQPGNYARFLGQELSLAFHGTLLVVMPNGSATSAVHAGASNLQSLVTKSSSVGGLGQTAINDVQRLASAAGHPLSVSVAGPRGSSGSTDYGALIALGVGALLVLAAWGLSLRARPLRGGHGTGAGGARSL